MRSFTEAFNVCLRQFNGVFLLRFWGICWECVYIYMCVYLIVERCFDVMMSNRKLIMWNPDVWRIKVVGHIPWSECDCTFRLQLPSSSAKPFFFSGFLHLVAYKYNVDHSTHYITIDSVDWGFLWFKDRLFSWSCLPSKCLSCIVLLKIINKQASDHVPNIAFTPSINKCHVPPVSIPEISHIHR